MIWFLRFFFSGTSSALRHLCDGARHEELCPPVLLSAVRPVAEPHDGVDFERERHSVMGPKHGLAIEIFTLRHPGRRGRSLMVTKEYWWAGEESKALKNLRWARPVSGQRADILSWLRVQEAKIGRESFVERDSGDKTSNNDELEAFEDGDRV